MPPGALVWVLLFAFVLLLVMVAMVKRDKLMFLGIGALVLLVVSGIYAVLDGLLLNWALVSMFSWWLVLVPLLTIGVIYVCLMYGRDCHSISVPWAALLGLLRLSVYGLLTVCFLLPAIQNYETTVTEAKILVVFDISGSIDATDGMSQKTRLEHIVDFLDRPYIKGQGTSAKTFIEHLQDVAPVTCYRFGGIDDYEPADFKGGQKWLGSEWHTWLEMKTDRKKETTDALALAAKLKGGEQFLSDKDQDDAKKKTQLFEQHKKAIKDSTDIGGSIKKILERESGSRIQAVIVFSDGKSNVPDQAALDDIVKQAGDKTKPFQIITVGVGDYKPVKKLEVDPLIAPESPRIDDKKFDIHVPFTGVGLQGKKFEVFIYATRKTDLINEIAKPQTYLIGYDYSAFGGGPSPSYQTDLEVIIANLHPDAAKEIEKKLIGDRGKPPPKVKPKEKDSGDEDPPMEPAKKKEIIGNWEIFAKVRVLNDDEICFRRASFTANAEVEINEAPMRVLLFASGPSRDYQFVKGVFARELEKKRVELSIYLQTAKDEQTEVTEDAEGIVWLPDFPTRLDAPKKVDKVGKEAPKDGKDAPKAAKKGDPMNLKSYDVIVAFDADWEQLIPIVKGSNKNQLELIKEWVAGEHRGGLIFVSGPQHTGRLIPPPDPDKRKTWPLKPVFDLMPVILKRPAPNLKNETLHDSTIPYQLNFTADAKAFDFLQLDPKSNSPTGGWAEFFGPQKKWDGGDKVHPERGFYTYYRVEDIKPQAIVLATFLDYKAPKTIKGKDQPYFVVLPFAASGKTFYIGSGEMWRLRTFKEKYHQVFWQNLVRYVSARTSGKSYGQFSMKREWEPGSIEIQAEVRDKNFMPLDPKQLDPKKPLKVTIKQLGTGGGKDEKPREVELKPKNKTTRPDGQFVAVTSMPLEGRFELRIDIPDTAYHIKKEIVIKRKSLETGDLRTDFPKLQSLASEPTPEVRKRLDAKLPQSDRDKDGGPPPGSSAARLFFILPLAEHTTECLERTPPATDTRKADREDLWNLGPMVYKLESWDDGPMWTILGSFTARTGPLLKTALFAIPGFTLLTVAGVMMIGRRWLTAAGVMIALVVIEIGMVLVTSNLTPKELFNPSVLGVVVVVPALIGLVAAGILLLAERYVWVAIVTGAVLVHLLIFGVFYWIADINWLESAGWLDGLPVDFVWLLLLIGLLLSLEWFTRKMLRLA
jgi:hypothetical protein